MKLRIILSVKSALMLLLPCWLLLTLNPILAANFGKINPDTVGYYVIELPGGKPLLSKDPDRPMLPASLMKLVTSWAALFSLGKNYRWRTTFTATAGVSNNHLTGDLYWSGSGDPLFMQSDLANMQVQLTDRGIHAIDGNLILAAAPDLPTVGSNGFTRDRQEIFAVDPSPHNLAFKLFNFYFYADNQGKPQIGIDPPLPASMFKNRISVTAAETCTALKSYLHYSLQEGQLHLYGKIPLGCIGESMQVNLLTPEQFAYLSFTAGWQAFGNGGPQGLIKIREHGNTPGQVLAVNYSPPLSTIITAMNKNSNNLIAKSIFLELGKHLHLPPALALNVILTAAGINTAGLELENGSGLSRRERLTPQFLGAILLKSYTAPFAPDFIKSLPIGGIDGTLSRRFSGYSELRLKTGTLDNVQGLAGYYLPRTPALKPLAIVVIINHDQPKNLQPDLDRLLLSLIEDAEQQLKTVK